MEKTDPFNQLNAEDQKGAVDVSVAGLLIGTRLDADKGFYDYVVSEFSNSRSIPVNLARYAFRSLGRSLAAQNWTLTIKKEGAELVTSFHPEPIKEKGANSELDHS